MQTFKIQALDNWSDIGGELMFFDATKPRTIRAQFNVTGPVTVWAGYDMEDAQHTLLAASDGLFEVEFTTTQPVYIGCVPLADETRVFVRTFDLDHRVAKTSDEKFTSLERRASRNPELDRMMMMMRLNDENRQRELSRELLELRALKAELAAKAQASVPVADPVVIEDEGVAE